MFTAADPVQSTSPHWIIKAEGVRYVGGNVEVKKKKARHEARTRKVIKVVQVEAGRSTVAWKDSVVDASACWCVYC